MANQIILCHICGNPATCIGLHGDDALAPQYVEDSNSEPQPLPSCDDCYGHGDEDG